MNLHNISRLFVADTTVRKVASISSYAIGSVRCIKLSPNGQFLAFGSDDGILEIRMYDSDSWRRVALYSSGTAIRAMVWHPLEPSTIIFGCASGNIHKIEVVVNGLDIVYDATVPGYIHVLSMSPDGRMLAIGHGHFVSVIKDPFPHLDDVGTLVGLEIPDLEVDTSFLDFRLPRGLYFLPRTDNAILVPSLGRYDICAYSSVDHCLLWSIPLRPGSFIGSSAISPSGERLAIMNLVDGIDFYSTSHHMYLSTTLYTLSRRMPPRTLLADMIFVDEETVAFGHSDGYIAFATFGVNSITGTFKPDGEGLKTPLQTLTFGITNDHPHIFGLMSSNRATGVSNRWISDVHIGRIDTPNYSRPFRATLSSPLQVRHYKNLTHLDLSRLELTRKQLIFVLVGFLSALVVRVYSVDSSKSSVTVKSDPPLPSRSPSDVCFCTISGSVVPDAPPVI